MSSSERSVTSTYSLISSTGDIKKGIYLLCSKANMCISKVMELDMYNFTQYINLLNEVLSDLNKNKG